MVVGLIVADRFGELGATERDTVPEKPLTLPIVTVVVAADPWTTVSWVGLTVSVKLCWEATTVTARVIEVLKLPEYPVTVTWYVPSPVPFVEKTVRTELADPPLWTVTFAGFRLVESPRGGLVVENIETLPAKPFKLVTINVDVPEEPRRMVRLDGFAEIEKLGVVLLLTATPTCTA
jgi:hypothetical protein